MAAPPVGTTPIQPSAGASSMLDAGSKPPPHMEEDDAGPAVPAAPSCNADQWALAPGFLLSTRVEYVEDRQDQPVPMTLSSAGTPCASARDRARCLSDLMIPTQFGRHLATTVGDKVEFWAGSAAFKLLGLIDTEAEAIWVLNLNGFATPCTLKVSKQDSSFRIENVPKPDYGCMPMTAGTGSVDAGPQLGSVIVNNDSSIRPEWLNDTPCGTPTILP
jgi:hypothetical protein